MRCRRSLDTGQPFSYDRGQKGFLLAIFHLSYSPTLCSFFRYQRLDSQNLAGNLKGELKKAARDLQQGGNKEGDRNIDIPGFIEIEDRFNSPQVPAYNIHLFWTLFFKGKREEIDRL